MADLSSWVPKMMVTGVQDSCFEHGLGIQIVMRGRF